MVKLNTTQPSAPGCERPAWRRMEERGFTVLFAVLMSGLLLAVGLSIFNIVFRELQLSGITRDSETAIFAADAGIECGLFWEFKGNNTFDISSPGTPSIDCGGVSNRTVFSVAAPTTTWTFVLPIGGANNQSCAEVSVAKDTSFLTKIRSNGRSKGDANCDPPAGDVRVVERSLEAHF